MNRKNHLAAVLLAAALVFSACNKPANDPQTADSDTASVTPEITETAPTPATPDIPVITEPQTESVQTEPVAVPDETEPPPEITEPLPELPAEIPTEDTTAVETEPTEATEPSAPAPIVIAKPTVDISDQLIPGGDPVSGQCASAQSENIRLILDYTAEQAEDGSVTLTINVGLSCYELWCSAKTDMGTITVNGVSRTFSTDAIDHMTHEKAYIPFLTQTYNATGSQSASIEVSWNFNGVYGGTEIGTLSTGVILTYDAEGSPAVPPVVIEPQPAETEPVPAETEPVPAETEPVPAEPPVTEPTETEPAPTEPEQPTEPPIDGETTDDAQRPGTEPTEPTEPAEPEVPTDPADPSIPEVPAEPTDPNMTQPPEQEPTDDGSPDDAYVIPPEEAGTP